MTHGNSFSARRDPILFNKRNENTSKKNTIVDKRVKAWNRSG